METEEDKIRRLYIVEKLGIREILEELGIGYKSLKEKLNKYGINKRNCILALDLTGQKFGKWSVVNRYQECKPKQIYWNCICECGNTSIIRTSTLRQNRSTSCGCVNFDKLWKGYGKLNGTYWGRIKKGAKIRNLEFNITIEYAWQLFIEQNGLCKLSNMPINFRNNSKDKSGATASLDRIDSSKGYIEGNVQWLHKDINKMKLNHDEKYFIHLCSLIVKTNS